VTLHLLLLPHAAADEREVTLQRSLTQQQIAVPHVPWCSTLEIQV
jgi:hypothetical protein